ncbi:MAG: TonB dependent receptor [Acidobacteria bacterium]|jgi:iron complex outermembrane receptor protein|nr:TonB dependent receptor [Acidobacteriota bacterium]
MLRHRFRSAAGTALLVLCAPPAALAAAPALSGRVVDRTGDPVPGATVTLACAGRAEVAGIETDDFGRFLVRVPEGCAPTLTASLPGLAAGTPVAIDAAAQPELELRLDLDLFADRIEVRESALADGLGSREIRESFARDVGDAALRVPGVTRLRKGGLANDVVLRGFKGENLAVLVDGLRVHGACPNRMDPPAFHVDFAEIERIDVAKGPSAAPGGGLGGTVNVVTREPAPGLHAEAQAAAGSFGYLAPSATVSWSDGRWSGKAGWAQRRGDPFEDGDGISITELLPEPAPAAYRREARDDRAFDVTTAWAGIGYSPAPGHQLELEATRQDGGSQLYPYLMMDAREDDAERARLAWHQTASSGLLRSLEAVVGWAAVDHTMDDRLRTSSTGTSAGWSMSTAAASSVLEARLEAGLDHGWTLGADGYRRSWRATTWLAPPGGMARPPQATIPDAELDAAGLYAQLERQLGSAIGVRGGARVERAESRADRSLADAALWLAYHGTAAASRDDLLVSADLGVSWRPAADWELAAAIGRSERPPDSQERYFALRRMGTDWVGNPELDPAGNTQLDLGLRWHAGRVALDLDAWYAVLDDAIHVVETERVLAVPGVTNSRARSWVNHDARMWGAEVSARIELGARTSLAASGGWVRGRREAAPELGIVDGDLPEMPPLGGRLSLRYEPGRWFVEAEGVAAARQDRVDSGLHEEATPAWSVLHLRAGWQAGRWSLLAGVDNLLDRAYREHLSYQRDPFRSGVAVPEPGRTYSLNLRVRG